MAPHTREGKAAKNTAMQNLTAALDSSGICLFTTLGIGAPELLAMLTGATGFDNYLEHMLRAGERTRFFAPTQPARSRTWRSPG